MIEIYRCLGGSHLHGTETEESDLDTRVIYHDTLAQRLSLDGGTTSFKDEETDTVYYELTHFARMLLKCSPTSIEIACGRNPQGASNFIYYMMTLSLDAQKYLDQCNGMIHGMIKKGTPKSLHHAARVHTHATLYAMTGMLAFDCKNFVNYYELMELKRGEIPLDKKYTERVELIQHWHSADKPMLEKVVFDTYMEGR